MKKKKAIWILIITMQNIMKTGIKSGKNRLKASFA